MHVRESFCIHSTHYSIIVIVHNTSVLKATISDSKPNIISVKDHYGKCTHTILRPSAMDVQSTNRYISYGNLRLFRDHDSEKIRRTFEIKSGRPLP